MSKLDFSVLRHKPDYRQTGSLNIIYRIPIRTNYTCLKPFKGNFRPSIFKTNPSTDFHLIKCTFIQ